MEYFKESLYNQENKLIKIAIYQLNNGEMIDYHIDYEEDEDSFNTWDVFGSSAMPDHWIDNNEEESDEGLWENEVVEKNDGYHIEYEAEELSSNAQAARAHGVDPFINVLFKYHFDKNKCLLRYQKFVRFYKRDALIEERKYEYDNYGNTIYVAEFDEDRGIDNFWKYDFIKINIPKHGDRFFIKSSNEDDRIITNYTYNNFGDVETEEIIFYDDNQDVKNSIIRRYEYRYNKKGRWFEKTIIEDNKMIKRYKRRYADFSKYFPHSKSSDFEDDDYDDLPF
ncbi:hypothetical protein [Aestuariivivens sediminicola]|uniref:hypothetical protein n=1 Tax=Aestuariivivens sediminicola TaxID=2913560 RepID=UPI001F579E6B|nr:hypothetical protein [Aestuariivivens sediminicola]